jgi:hypothetical protein
MIMIAEGYRQARRAALVGMIETTCRLAEFCVADGEPLEDVAAILGRLRELIARKEPP